MTCALAHNAINGRYCNPLKQYVEHASVPPCSTKVKSETK